MRAQNYLGVMYREGQSVPRSDAEAVKWFQFAASHRSPEGCHNLALMYSKGRGLTRDEVQASAYFLKGAMLEYPESQVELARRHVTGEGVSIDLVEACAWYDVAVRAGHSAATVTRDAMMRSLSSTQVSAARARSDAIKTQIEAEEIARSRP
jgi:TPR repeat protein